ncbi:MAG TPA: bifunctional hydroxymethylpyrimidine kinase/phosphomethylpyrimidine kinase [Acidobacteriota bacterium]
MGKPKTALSIAGSDSGGCSGIQADLRTFARFGVHGASAITCITAQNTRGVQKVVPLLPATVTGQIESVLSDIGCDAAKTGMLGTGEIIRAVARCLRKWKVRNLVVDPVMVSTSGVELLQRSAISTLCEKLIPLARLVTPNLLEAERILKQPVRSISDMESAAKRLYDWTGCAVLIKGGHLDDKPTDVLYAGTRCVRFTCARVRTRNTRGSGCSLSAAIAANLARHVGLEDAIAKAKDYVTEALRKSYRIGAGPGRLG